MMKRFVSPNPNESHSLSILNKGRSPYERRHRKGKNYRKSNYNSAIVVYVARAASILPLFIPQPVREQKIQSKDFRAQNSQSHVIGCSLLLRSSPAISHLAGEPDPAFSVPTDNWTNRSHSLRANRSSPSHLLSFFLSSLSFALYVLIVLYVLFSFSLFLFSAFHPISLNISAFIVSLFVSISSFHCLRSSLVDHLILHLRFFQKMSYFLRKNPE